LGECGFYPWIPNDSEVNRPMAKHTPVPVETEVSSFDVSFRQTRGSLREQEKQRRKLARVQGRTLLVGLDLAQEKQAISFVYKGRHLGRKRMDCAPQRLGEALGPYIRQLCEAEGLDRAVIGIEPASYFWELAAESFEAAGLDCVILHTLSVKRERETVRYTPEKTDPRDADLACSLMERGQFTDARLPRCEKRAAMAALAREYLMLRARSASELARLKSFWGRVLPELGELLKEPGGITGLAISRAMLPFSELVQLREEEWLARVRAHAGGRVMARVSAGVLQRVSEAHAAAHRRSGEGVPRRIRLCAERRAMLERQKHDVSEALLALYDGFPESVLMDSVPGSNRLYSALTLGLAGDLSDYDCGRALVKQAGSEVNEYASGEWRGRSRISHRGRAGLRTAAYQQAKMLVRTTEGFRERFVRLSGRLTPKQAYVAVANAWLRLVHTLVTTGQPWRADAGERGT